MTKNVQLIVDMNIQACLLPWEENNTSGRDKVWLERRRRHCAHTTIAPGHPEHRRRPELFVILTGISIGFTTCKIVTVKKKWQYKTR